MGSYSTAADPVLMGPRDVSSVALVRFAIVVFLPSESSDSQPSCVAPTTAPRSKTLEPVSCRSDAHWNFSKLSSPRLHASMHSASAV